MLQVFKLLLLVAFCVSAGTANDEHPVSHQNCAADVCSFIVWAKNLISQPCRGYSVDVAYSKLNGATLIQCSQPSTWQSNKSFIYDRSDPKVKPLEVLGWRFIRPEAFDDIKNGIPD